MLYCLLTGNRSGPLQMLNRNPAMNLSWLWTLLPLLLAASLVVPVLGRDVSTLTSPLR